VTIRQNVALIADIAVLRDFVEEDPALAWSRG
jgi:CRP/FNR family transcriptional regulator, dissimilatory nitrate respiration regulator